MLRNEFADVGSLQLHRVLKTECSDGSDCPISAESFDEDLRAAGGVEPEEICFFPYARTPIITQMYPRRRNIERIAQHIDRSHSDAQACESPRSDDRGEMREILIGSIIFLQNIFNRGNQIGVALRFEGPPRPNPFGAGPLFSSRLLCGSFLFRTLMKG